MRSMRWRRWSDLSQVERVDFYTRQSLRVILWLLCGFALFAATDSKGFAGVTAAGAVFGAVTVTSLATWVMPTVFAQYPRAFPLPWRALSPLVVACAVYAATVIVTTADDGGVMAATVVASLAWTVGALPDNRIAAALAALSGVLFGLSGGSLVSIPAGIGFGAFLIFTSRTSLWLYGIVTELDSARQAQAQLAVAEERLRFSRDVHDVLGRRLSTIAVQSELAATLAERGDDRAADRMLEVRGVAHETLREARELARGYRPTDLATELAGARSLLASAGIDVVLDVDGLPRAWHEAAGWVVRECVTNVLRHSAASLVEVSYAGDEVRIANDGVRTRGSGDAAPSVTDWATMSGLRGLRERLDPLGATLAVEQDDGRWTVVAALPAGGPLGSTVSAEATS